MHYVNIKRFVGACSAGHARPVPYNCATPEKQDECICETAKMLKKYDNNIIKQYVCGRHSLCGCAPPSTLGILVKGRKDMVLINFSRAKDRRNAGTEHA